MLESIAKFLAENEWIKWIPTLIIVLIMVWWTIHGYLRGFRKSAHKFIALIVSFLIALLCF